MPSTSTHATERRSGIDPTIPATGCLVGGVAGAVAAIASPAIAAGSALAPVALATVAGFGLGALVGWRRLSVDVTRRFVERKRLILASAVGLLALLGGVLVAGYRAATLDPFWPGMGAIALAVVGWVVLLQTGQNAESRTAIEESAEVVALPPDSAYPGMDGYLPDMSRVRRVMAPLVALAIAVLVGLALLEGELFLLVFALPGVSYLVQFSGRETRITDAGLVFEQSLLSRSVSTKLVEWDAFEGYRVDDDAVTIVYDSWWSDLTYDRDAIDDVDRVTAALDRHLPRLSD